MSHRLKLRYSSFFESPEKRTMTLCFDNQALALNTKTRFDGIKEVETRVVEVPEDKLKEPWHLIVTKVP